jgi:Zn-dependent protease with chaperone function
VADLERITARNQGMRGVDFLENHWPWVSLITVVLLACIAAITYFGIPAAARAAANFIPPQLMEGISAQALQQIDAHFLKTSRLTPQRKYALQALVPVLEPDFNPLFKYHLEFREGGPLGANALALPSGAIVITDELVGLAKDDKEIASVLAHEMAHVDKRHALRGILQDAGVFLLISILVGDVNSITSIAASLPTLLVESGYSRQFETEADETAGKWLIRKGWGTKPFRDILQRLAEHHGDFPGPTWLSSHPDTTERIAHLRTLEKGPATKGRPSPR